MTHPDQMKAMVLTAHGDMDAYRWREDWPVPELSADEVMIRIGACGLNNTDVNTRSGWYSKTIDQATTGSAYETVGQDDPSWGGAAIQFPRIQGADAVGTVVAVGDQADPTLIGRRVLVDPWLRDWDDPMNLGKTGYFGSECDGGFAEYAKVNAQNVHPIDSSLTDPELATFACSYSTAEGMLCRADVGPEDTVLVTGASGGVGSALVQLAKRRGARTIAMASASKHAKLSILNPDLVIDRAPEDLKATLGSEKVTVIADIVGGPYWPTLIDVLARGGRYTCSGAIAGPMVTLDLRTLYLRDLTFCGSTVLPLHVFKDIVGYIEKGEIKPVLAATYPLSDLKAAQQAFIDKQHLGNIVVTS